MKYGPQNPKWASVTVKTVDDSSIRH